MSWLVGSFCGIFLDTQVTNSFAAGWWQMGMGWSCTRELYEQSPTKILGLCQANNQQKAGKHGKSPTKRGNYCRQVQSTASICARRCINLSKEMSTGARLVNICLLGLLWTSSTNGRFPSKALARPPGVWCWRWWMRVSAESGYRKWGASIGKCWLVY